MIFGTSGIDKVEKNDIKLKDFFIIGNIALRGTSQGHVLSDYTFLKKYLISSREYLAYAFMKNNHHLDF